MKKEVRDLLAKRLLDNSVVHPSGCVEWVGARNSDGYGYLSHGKAQWRVHRLSYTLSNGSIPSGKVVLHSCDNPSCINTEHLSIGSVAENNRDRAEKGRNRDQRGEKNNMAKLSNIQRDMVRVLSRAGFSQDEIGKVFGLTQVGVSRVTNQ